jgi:iron complex outermembrane receptor protein
VHPEGAADFDDDWWLGQVGVRAEWPRAFGTITLLGGIDNGRHGQRVEVSTFSPAGRQRLDGLVLTSGGHLVARLEHEAVRGTIRAQLSYDRVVWEAPHFAETRDAIDFDYTQTLRLGSRHDVTFGGGARWSPGRFRQQLETLSFTPAYHVDRVHSLFVQDDVQLVPDRLALILGTKVEHNTYTDVEWLPTARLAWTPHPRHSIWAAATRGVRTPSRIERSINAITYASPFGPLFLDVQGSEAFEAEEAVGYEGGYRVLITPTISLFAAAFHTEHDDLAAFGFAGFRVETTPPPPRLMAQFPYRNGIKGQSTGAEIVPEWRPADWWRLRGWYAYRQFDFHTKPGIVDPASVRRVEGASPANQGRVESRLTLPGGWEVDAAYRHVGRLKAYGIPSYRTGDLRLGWQATPQLGLSVTGQNLLQPHHLEFPHVGGTRVGMARRVQAAVTWTYATH